MPELPFYNEEYTQDTSEMKGWEKDKTAQHGEVATSFEDYRRQSDFDRHAVRGMRIYNVVQTARPTDETSRIFLGTTRTVIDRGHEQMTEGDPGFETDPRSTADYKKKIIWDNLIENILSDSEYHAHQNLGFKDLLTTGSVVYEQFNNYPYKSVLVPNSKSKTGYESVMVRDFTRPQIGIRHVSPLDAWRNPNISNPTEVGSCWKREVYTWNQCVIDFGRARLQDGSYKYKNLMKISKGTHVVVYVFQDEYTGEYAKYAIGFGNQNDAFSSQVPHLSAVKDSTQIFYKPLKIHEVKKDGKTLRSDGLNVQGKCSLRWGTYLDAYDKNYRGTHSVYGMGIPQRIEAEDMTMQMIFNTNLDNYRWTNAVVLNYEGANADSYLDVDANRFVGGELVDGKITPQPLGISRIGDYQAMRNDLEDGLIPATGINHRAITGDPSGTAFEFQQRLKLSSRSAEQTLVRLENELFKPIGELLLGAAINELTVDEYEDMTPDQAKEMITRVKDRKETNDDYKDLSGDKPQRRVKKYIKIKGYKAREDFTNNKKRTLDYDDTKNTLVLDESIENETSFVPLVNEYVNSQDFKDTGRLPGMIVDSKRMLGDRKARDAQNTRVLLDYLLKTAEIGLIDPQTIDVEFFTKEFANFAGMDPDKAIKGDDSKTNEQLSQAKEMLAKIKQLQSSPTQNVQVPAQVPDTGGISPVNNGQKSPDNALQAAAEGRL